MPQTPLKGSTRLTRAGSPGPTAKTGEMGLNGAPARIHVLFARDSEKAVVVRRGPSKSVCTVAWNRRNDTFALGQWFHGRIYERRSDLSPDGKYLIYFASDGCWNSDLKGSWTAISRAPYLKAIGLWAKGDCWNGGGLFTSPNRYWLNDGCGHDLRLAPTKLEREELPRGRRLWRRMSGRLLFTAAARRLEVSGKAGCGPTERVCGFR